jgi:hypothetical protein
MKNFRSCLTTYYFLPTTTMQDSKLIEILRSLQPRELADFLDYLQSPYFNKSEQMRELGVYLAKFAPTYQHPTRLKKEKIFDFLYPRQEYDDTLFYSLFSKLLKILYAFLAQQAWDEEERLAELFLLRQLGQRKVAEKHLASVRKRFPNLLPKANRSQTVIYWESFLYYNELDLAFLSEGGRKYDENLQQKNDILDVLFVSEKLKIACDMLSRNVVTQAQYEPTMLDILLTYLDTSAQEKLNSAPVVQIYRCIIETLRQPDDLQLYWRLKTLLLAHYADFGKDEAMNMYGYLLNYCIRKINAGQVEFFEEVWQHYQLLVDTKLIYIGEYLPPWEYKQIITTALRLNKNAWARAFAEKYRDELPNDARQNAYLYNMAAIYYSDKDYRAALLTLQNVTFTDTTYELGARLIQVKSYYELSEFEALRSLIEAFLIYVQRNKEISDYRKSANSNFLKIVRKLLPCKQLYEEKTQPPAKIINRLASLRLQIDAKSPLANKDWLQAVSDQLLARMSAAK